MQPAVFPTVSMAEYGLLDSGEGRKLERFGELVLDRPDPQALWRPRLTGAEWKQADLRFERESDRGGRWVPGADAHRAARLEEPTWTLRPDPAGAAVFWIKPTPFKHVGFFPEQATNWAWGGRQVELLGGEPRILNLFGYTGVASVLAALAGCRVTHVDASRTSLAWMRENALASGLAADAVRIVLDDALGFARREARRRSRYDGILLDPPHYGRGPKGEKWQFEEGIGPLLEVCSELLAERGFLLLSTYAIGYSPLAFLNILEDLGGDGVEAGELAIHEEPLPSEGGRERLLPCGFSARWTRGLAEGS